MVYAKVARPPEDLLRKAKWRKEQGCAWFHKVTSEMNEAQVVLECVKRKIAVDGRSMHDLQTELLQAI